MSIESQTIVLKSRAFSINKMHYRTKTHTTPEYKAWACNILSLMNSKTNQSKLKILRDKFDYNEHRYCLTITYYFPHHILFTEKGYMSSYAFDVSNIEKPLIDLIFLPKNHSKTPNINVDDKYISDLTSRKRASEDFLIEIKIDIESLKEIKNDPLEED